MLKAFTITSKLSSALSRKMSSASKKFVGLCQMRATNDKDHNRQQISELFSRAKGQASVLFFPECCDYLGANAAETQGLAESLSGETVKFYQDLCSKNQIWVNLKILLIICKFNFD
jgi:deaminated glutathione amidase